MADSGLRTSHHLAEGGDQSSSHAPGLLAAGHCLLAWSERLLGGFHLLVVMSDAHLNGAYFCLEYSMSNVTAGSDSTVPVFQGGHITAIPSAMGEGRPCL